MMMMINPLHTYKQIENFTNKVYSFVFYIIFFYLHFLFLNKPEKMLILIIVYKMEVNVEFSSDV
jgi:hypothetical protein